MKWPIYILLCLFALSLFACRPIQGDPDDPIQKGNWAAPPGFMGADSSYKFFVAGHVYGEPGTSNTGVHKPFRKHFPALNSDPDMRFGVLTGDMVRVAQPSLWDDLDADLAQLDMPVYFAPGNHDLDFCNQVPQYEARYGPRSYSFRMGPDLFLVWDANCTGWAVPDEQIAMLEEAFADDQGIRNVYIFVHQIIWYIKGEGSFGYPWLVPNSLWAYWKPNFHNQILPLLQQLDGEVWLFSGDTGAFCSGREVSYHRRGNVHMVSSGMGCTIKGNYLEVRVNNKGQTEVKIVPVGTNAVPSMGELWDHQAP